MNRKVLLGVVIVLTLITAGIHLTLGSGMFLGRPGGRGSQNGGGPRLNGTPPADFTPGPGGQGGGPGGGPGADQGGGPGGANGQGGAPNGGGGQFGGRQGGPGGGAFAIFRFLPYLFLLNGLGYLALLALIVFPVPYFKDHAALAHWLLIGFAAVTIVAFFVIMGPQTLSRNMLALVAKPDEALLIVFTFLHLRSLGTGAPAPAAPAAPAAS